MSATLAGGDVLLEACDVVKTFGGITALHGVSLHVPTGSVTGLIGPNGSGKTTLLNCVSGVLKPSAGAVSFRGTPVTGWPADRMARRGVVRTFQNIRLFGALSAAENVEVNAVAAGNRRRAARRVAREVMRRMDCEHLAGVETRALSYGDQRRVEIARALAGSPEVLLLDEPAAGMNDAESHHLGHQITMLTQDPGCGVLLVEHDLRLIMSHCTYIYVLNEGQVISEGTPEHVSTDPAVVTAYIGDEDSDDAASARERAAAPRLES
ncbi:MAG: branched-chain amino acid transport system ATP-binding protein [Solirubrobacteraceae bacterium]|nr:branched-chain amino acid transport system ATP-binding protein [Solirubrobacteraceae bacterium]